MTEVRKKRLEQMLSVLWECGREGGCTRRDIAQMLGLKKTPYLLTLIAQLVADGWIIESWDLTSWPHRMVYRPSDKLTEWHAANSAA